MKNYLRILEESLHKKLTLLDEIQAYNEAQQQVFASEQVQVERFDEYIAKKGQLIEAVIRLDDGFEMLYANVAETLKENRSQYAEQIKILQQLIYQVTEKSVSIQAQEARTKAMVEAYFAKEKEQIGMGRRNSKVAFDYYSNINKQVYSEPQFMDSRK